MTPSLLAVQLLIVTVGYTAVGITNILVVFFYSLSTALDTVEIIAKNYDINKSF